MPTLFNTMPVNYLIKSWRKRAKDITKELKLYPNSCLVSDLEASRGTLLRCAKELARVNTFKFCVGDEVTANGRKLIIIKRSEMLINKELKRLYECNNTLCYSESELS